MGDVVDHLVRTDPGGVLGAYLHGSATNGGLRPDSDLDLLVVTERPLDRGERAQVLDLLLRRSGQRATERPGRPLELTSVALPDVRPWRYPPRCDFLYGEWLRDDLVGGVVPQPHVNPDLAVALTAVRHDGIALHGPPAAELLDPVPPEDLRRAVTDSLGSLLDDLVGDERNVLLTLARMVVTLETGEIVPKDVAAHRVSTVLGSSDRRLLEMAAAAYTGAARDDWRLERSAAAAAARHLAERVRRLGG